MKVTQTGIAVALAIVVVAIVFFFPELLPFSGAPGAPAGAGTTASGAPVDMGSTTATGTGAPQDQSTTQPTAMPTENQGGLQTTDEVVGTGAAAAPGDTVTVNYVGTFTNGTVFDSSASHPETANGFTFTLGAGQVIPGWDQGVVGMKVGGKRKLVVPPALGYGSQDYGPIPGNSTLVFEIELLKVQPGSAAGTGGAQ